MQNKKHFYYIGTLLLALPVAFLYVESPLWIAVISFCIGFIVFNYNRERRAKVLQSKTNMLRIMAASFMGVAISQATRETVDLGLLFESVFKYAPFQFAYVTFLLSHCYIKTIIEPSENVTLSETKEI